MFPLTYGAIYKMPEEHQPPEETELASNTDYPNLNSRDYAKRPLNHTLRMHGAWECIGISKRREEGDNVNIVVCCNKLSGRQWTGSLWGYETNNCGTTTTLTTDNACFKLQCTALVTRLQYVSHNIFLLALNSGKLQVWSTYAEVRNAESPYCLFLIGEKTEHARPIVSMTGMKTNENKAVTGSKDGTLKIWDLSGADLDCVHTFRFAHTDSVTGMDSDRCNDSLFVTCSLDRSALYWDDRQTRPAIAICENHSVRFRDVCFAAHSVDASENVIYLGDESGFVHSIDGRIPNKILCSSKYFDRPLRKMVPNGENLALIADSNIVKVANAATHEAFYENADSQHFVRDCVWSTPSELLSVGFEGKMRSHQIN